MKQLNNLLEIYEIAFQECMKQIGHVQKSNEGGPTNPQLIQPTDNYKESSLKIMYIGQETNGWEGAYCESKGVHHLLKVYDDFVNKGGAFKYGGQFWNAIKFFQSKFVELNPSSQFVWTNLIKVGKDWSKGRPNKNVLEWQAPWDAVFKNELKILNPDITIFFTGPYYDDLIRKHFSDIEFIPIEGYKLRQFCILKSKDLPENSFRTYHPGYLYRFGLYRVNELILKMLKT